MSRGTMQNRSRSETYDEVGYNYRMTDMQAAIGIAQLNRLPGFLERRRYLAHRYTEALRRPSLAADSVGPGELPS